MDELWPIIWGIIFNIVLPLNLVGIAVVISIDKFLYTYLRCKIACFVICFAVLIMSAICYGLYGDVYNMLDTGKGLGLVCWTAFIFGGAWCYFIGPTILDEHWDGTWRMEKTFAYGWSLEKHMVGGKRTILLHYIISSAIFAFLFFVSPFIPSVLLILINLLSIIFSFIKAKFGR